MRGAGTEGRRRRARRLPGPRYTLCRGRISRVPVQGGVAGEALVVFAASIAQRYNWGPVLQAALLLDAPTGWKVHLPKVGSAEPSAPFDSTAPNMSYRDASWLSGISAESFAEPASRFADLRRYGKCFNTGLPSGTEVHCRLGMHAGEGVVPANASWSQGRLVRCSNGELRHEFAVCPVGGQAYRWQRQPDPPRRLRLELGVSTPVAAGGRTAVAPLELCLVEAPLRPASICTMPLYGFGALRREHPWALDDWLTYHLDIVGFDHATVYDIDGSLAEGLESWRGRGVSYHGAWPAALSPAMAAISKSFPSCAETWAYAHCVVTHRATSRWVVLLHNLDEYVVARNRSVEGALPAALREIQAAAGDAQPQHGAVGVVQLRAASLARGGPGAEEAPRRRGSILAASRLRGHWHDPFTPMINPGACLCAGPHTCYAPVGVPVHGMDRLHWVGTEHLVVNHYLEMFHRNAGRCGRVGHGPCNVWDSSMVGAVRLLRSRM